MKNKNGFIALMTGLLLLFHFSCTENEEPTPPPGEIKEGQGISENELDAYEGEVGLVLNARQVARKGYRPTVAEVEIQTSGEVLRKTVPLDPFGFMGLLKFPVNELTEAQLTQITDGVQVLVTLKDETNQEIVTKSNLGTISLLPNLSPVTINADFVQETEEASDLLLMEGTGLYFQKLNDEGMPVPQAMRWNRTPNFGNVMTFSTNETFSGDQPDFLFNIFPVPGRGNTFYIRLVSTGHYLRVTEAFYGASIPARIHIAPVNSGRNSLINVSNSDKESYHFQIRKVRDGVFELLDHRNRPIREAAGVGLTVNFPGAKNFTMRIVAKEVEWSAQPITSSILEPILPKVTSGFSFNSTLTNCSGGQLQQTVGADFSEVRTTTVGWSESISVNTSKSVSVSATLGVTIKASFFGKGAEYNASVTKGFEWSQSITSSSSQYESQTISKSESYFSSRVITVPPRSASLVYDAYQYYENVRVNYVQRIRISGRNENGRSLTGEEIKSLFIFSNFNGVINSVEENSVVVTLTGFTILDKFIETQSTVREVPPNCS
ncbi:hypothetical protein SAMN00777080_1213 [Aquiflexum balticum DSM 16537]|uniref:Toxin ETX/toxin MTX2 n=1 Tax=Aquiflexum balticum DSM 16537 TaxID=758820 RepID=A0A1W2H205_9BACT|nr:hypothetical protein [Aquiflexum balticum]SMD42652.1 hypothetical protein SAMN00777080_1213 [Aquiflexum balticum DSM 16537]